MFDRPEIFLMRQFHVLDGHIVLLIQPGAAFALADIPERLQVYGRIFCLGKGDGAGLDADVTQCGGGLFWHDIYGECAC